MFPVGGLIKKAKAMIPKTVSAAVKTVAKTAVKAVLNNTGSVVNNIQKGASAISKTVAAIPKKINANAQKVQAVTQKVAAAVPKAVNAVKSAGKQQLDAIVQKGNEVKASIQSIANDMNQKNQRILDKINQEALGSSIRIIKGSLSVGALSPMNSSKNISIALDFLLKSRKIIIEEYPILNIRAENSKKFISYIENQAKNLNDSIGSTVYNANIPMISDTVGAFTGQRDPNAKSNIFSMQGAFYRGIYVKGLGGTIDALANLAADPFEAIEGLNSIALEPEVMIPGIFSMAKEYVNTKIIDGSAEDRAEVAGQLVFEIAQFCIGTGEVKAGTKVTELSMDAAKTSKALNATNKVNEFIKAEKFLNSTLSKGLRETFSVAAKNAGQNAVDSIDYLRLLFRNGSSNMNPAYAGIGAIDDFVGTGEMLQKSLSKFKSMASEVTQGKGVNFKPKINNSAIEEGAEKASKVVSEGTGEGIKNGTGRGYKVDSTMYPDDEAAGVLRNGEYVRNPTAHNIKDYVSEGSNYLGNKNMNGKYMYAVDMDGNIIIGTRGGQRMPHPTLIGGKNPQVQAAGMVEVRGGKIYSIDNASGHFKPSNGCLTTAEDAFGNLPQNIYSKDFKGFLPYGE